MPVKVPSVVKNSKGCRVLLMSAPLCRGRWGRLKEVRRSGAFVPWGLKARGSARLPLADCE